MYGGGPAGSERTKRPGSWKEVCGMLRIMLVVVAGSAGVHLLCFHVLSGDDASSVVTPSRWSEQSLSSVSPSWRRNLARSKTPKVLMVSASQALCGTRLGDNDIMKSLKNKADYARRAGMDTWFSLELLVEGGNHRFRNKVLLLRHLMRSQPSYDWFIWIDSDTMILDMDFRIPWQEYNGYSLVMWGDGPSLDFDPHYTRSLNTGVMFVRNDDISREFFDTMVDLWDSHPNQTEVYLKVKKVLPEMPPYLCDQGSAIYMLMTQKDRWLPRVYLEERYHINRYWKDEADNLDKYMEQRETWRNDGNQPPFIMHFCGCALCYMKFSVDFDECQRQHDRAFNFADNQIIRDFGFMHRNLSSSEVVPIIR
ncbi:hypothetical protein CBR_g37951 [Chara braunii]|uniref:GT34-family glycosyltransferase n=1 Tax=Chara braunii TaxID=69332 RepID=A0A388LNZ9_CHABU|nr:hypothetical protein CBR_g37951 [Chara braunii]|eukprot:GBG84076.1 hypothetical protein CBR_g37951 [Chara braunii]